MNNAAMSGTHYPLDKEPGVPPLPSTARKNGKSKLPGHTTAKLIIIKAFLKWDYFDDGKTDLKVKSAQALHV
jgi:hypothetical protein